MPDPSRTIATMKIISTNTGAPKTIDWNGKKVLTGIYKYSVAGPVFLGKEDVENDSVMDRKHHGGFDKACYLYSADHYSYWKALYPAAEMPWGMFGENLTVEGLHEGSIHIGDVFRAGEAVVQVTQPRQPCYKLGIRFGDSAVVKKFAESGFPGVYVRIIETGHVVPGDPFICIEKKNSFSVQKIFEMLYSIECSTDEILAAIDNPYLAASCRNDLLKRMNKCL